MLDLSWVFLLLFHELTFLSSTASTAACSSIARLFIPNSDSCAFHFLLNLCARPSWTPSSSTPLILLDMPSAPSFPAIKPSTSPPRRGLGGPLAFLIQAEAESSGGTGESVKKVVWSKLTTSEAVGRASIGFLNSSRVRNWEFVWEDSVEQAHVGTGGQVIWGLGVA